MQTNLSFHHNQFSDFPWDQRVSDFPSQIEVNEYLGRYASTFNIYPYIQFNTEVRRIERYKNRWIVEWIKDGNFQIDIFDYVIVSSGYFSKKFMPKIPGIATFKGDVLHSSEYKSSKPFQDKCIAVIGNSFSGHEIASDLASAGAQVFHLMNRMRWILPRYFSIEGSTDRNPIDLNVYSRAASKRTLQFTQEELYARNNDLFKMVCKTQVEVCPDLEVTISRTDPPYISISDDYLNMVSQRKVEVKKECFNTLKDRN